MRTGNRMKLISAFITTAMMAGASAQAHNAFTQMKAELHEKGIDINELAQHGRKGRPAHVVRTGAAAAKRAARKRRNIRARASKRA